MSASNRQPPTQHNDRLTSLKKRLPKRLRPLATVLSGQSARAGYLAAFDQSLISLSNFLATLIIARNATPTEFGVYVVGFTALRLMRSIQEGVTIQPLNTIGAPMDGESFKRYATSTGLIQVALALISAAGAAILGWALTSTGNDTAGPGIFALWPAFLFWQMQEYLRRMLYTRSRVLAAALNTSLASALRIGLLILWSSAAPLTGADGLTAIAWGGLIGAVFGFWQSRIWWGVRFSNLRETWRRNWEFGRWILGGLVANWLAVEFYPVLTAGLISFAAAGAYRALQNLVAPIHMLLRAVDTFLTPRAALIYHTAGMRGLKRIMRLAYLFLGIPVLGMLLIATIFPKPLLNLLYGATYLEYSNGIYLMAVFYGLLYAAGPLQSMLKALRVSRPIFFANIATALIMGTIGIFMVLRWDVYGTIGGQALNALVVNLILWTSWRTVQRQAEEVKAMKENAPT